MRSPLVYAACLGWALSARAAGPIEAPDTRLIRVGAESVLIADRWRGARRTPIDRSEVRQRLWLDVFSGPGRGAKVSFVSDLEVGSDLGLTTAELEAQPDGRRTRLDLHRAVLRVEGAWNVLDLQLGRHQLLDPLGFDALDGLSLRLAAPHLAVDASAGLAARRGWSEFGPDIYSPDGTELPEEAGFIVGGGLSTQNLNWLTARASWRRHFDDVLQREEAGLVAELRPWSDLRLDTGGVYDALFQRFAETWAGLGWAGERLQLHGEWRRTTPRFSGDSIWNAFGPLAANAASGRLQLRLGRWTVRSDGGLRLFDDAEAAWDAGFRLARDFERRGERANAGLEARYGDGYGGARGYSDVFGRVPLWPAGPRPPIWLRARLGVLLREDPRLTDTSGWALAALAWRSTERLRLEGSVEGFAGGETPYRFRVMARMRVEDWW